jgi:hypothetical protein
MEILVNQVPAGQIDLEAATDAVTRRLDDPDGDSLGGPFSDRRARSIYA